MNMNTIELARELASYHQTKEAQKAYFLALQELDGTSPDLELEAASYIFFSEGNYRTAYTTFVSLYNRGYFQTELMDLLTQAFYLPNVEEQKKRYEKNCKLLSNYPYLFRKDFLSFDALPIQFFPFNDRGFIPYDRAENRFGAFIDFNDPVIDRYFFKDLENPILAEDVYSQYQLEYLQDTVRKSEWIGRENHIYLHYTNWSIFCAHLSCLSMQALLGEKKFVFLIEEERSQYPIDFKARFGLDYSRYPVKPLGIREIHRLIWHTQLSTHNGGDFFNEIFYGHPNLLCIDSILFENIQSTIKSMRESLHHPNASRNHVLRRLLSLPNLTDKDCLVAIFLYDKKYGKRPDPAARIVPALFFQPHFGNMFYDATVVDARKGWTTLSSKQYNQLRDSPIFQGFRYIKTFTPMRRITTSFGATTRFMVDRQTWSEEERKPGAHGVLPDLINTRMLNRSYLIDPWDRLYHDSILVRFEDGKLNPKATFTALAKFLDIPYTESMTCCSSFQGINAKGFDTDTVYRTYDQYAGEAERAYLEFFFRDVYTQYGYDFQSYHGEPVDEAWILDKLDHFTITDGLIVQSMEGALHQTIHITDENLSPEDAEKLLDNHIQEIIRKTMKKYRNDRLELAKYLLKNLRFINGQGQPLQMMKLLKLDPALLEQPLYR